MRWLDGIIDTMDMSMSKLWEIMDREVDVLQSKGSERVGYNLATEQQPLVVRLILLKVKPSL